MIESKRRAFIFITLAILLALIAGFLVLQKVRQLNADLGGMTKIYVAKENVPSRELLTPDDVTTEEIPNRYITASHITERKDLVDKVATVPLTKGDIITKNMLKQTSSVLNEDNRLVMLYASDKVRFDEEVEALDRVDIIVSQQLEGKPKTEIFMSDVKVSRAYRTDKKQFYGVALEVSIEDTSKLVHIQNYSDSVRVIKANVGQAVNKSPEANEPSKEAPKAPPVQQEQKAPNTKETKDKPAQQPTKPAEQPVKN
ncbi:flagella basal body P-ring formation protein FlgA [Fictibacillus sp. 7GRE50]|uniref:Flp pilus assembly protein CpaB n=1 Tax=unclassified Fictibacillus TaxID=2644029 RepID=UPI0018CF869A|nr:MULTISPECIES: SAF domain-containing protein [unclassified Fictibacillus]MBH0167582.1 flagella basal body P-ring formation protein FlgA [Fictibacillus sp. 7GRE50]MBH0176163.1 flagella basal body P-ring formation protein FlgA [Fictibacillus sp. 23RED33]